MRIHLIAIGGTGMGALAGLLKEAGHQVRGSDQKLYPPMSTLLAALEIPVAEGYGPHNLDWEPELVVLGNTCKKDHPEYLAAKARGFEIRSFPALLSELFLKQRSPVVVAGTHGKTTTTALMAHLLSCAGTAPGYLVGGVPLNFGRSFAVGQPPHFVIEGDEYDTACFDKRPKFVHYRTQTLILTGIEFDHADIYDDLAAVKAAFAQLVPQLPRSGKVFVFADSPTAIEVCQKALCPVETYATATPDDDKTRKAANWVGIAKPLAQNTAQQLTIHHADKTIGPVEVPLTGEHNMQNCVAVAAAATHLGIDEEAICNGLRTFAGVRRRQDVLGVVNDVTVIDDFAHHPTAIEETLKGLRKAYPQGRLIAAFEPRSSTSRRNVFQERFAKALACADLALIAPLFALDKVPADQRLDCTKLAREIQEISAGKTVAHAFDTIDQMLALLLKACRPHDTVVSMSSGGFEGLPWRLVQALKDAS